MFKSRLNLCSVLCFILLKSSLFILCFFPLHHLCHLFFTVTFCPPSLAFTHFAASSFSHTRPQSTHTHMHAHTNAHPPSLFGCLCSTGSKSLVAACSSPNLPSLCTIALGTKLRPHNSRPARVNSRANTVKAKTHFLLSPTSPAKN